MLKKVVGPSRCIVGNRESIIDGLWRIGKKLRVLKSREMLVVVEHVKAHRTKKDKNEMSQFEKFVAEGNKKADVLAKAGAIMDEGFKVEMRAKTFQQEREEVVRSFAASKLCRSTPTSCRWSLPTLHHNLVSSSLGNRLVFSSESQQPS